MGTFERTTAVTCFHKIEQLTTYLERISSTHGAVKALDNRDKGVSRTRDMKTNNSIELARDDCG